MAQRFWKLLGLEDRIEQKPRNVHSGFVIHANHALYVDFEPNFNVQGVYPRHTLRPLQRRLGLLDPTSRDRVLYFRRRESRRRVADEAELLGRIETLLEPGPYQFEIFEHRDLESDMERMRRARIVLGPHGGAFQNLIFAQPGTHVVEFLPIYDLPRRGVDARHMYWGLAQAAGLDYWTVTPRRFGFEDPEMIMDAESVLAVLKRILEISPLPG